MYLLSKSKVKREREMEWKGKVGCGFVLGGPLSLRRGTGEADPVLHMHVNESKALIFTEHAVD